MSEKTGETQELCFGCIYFPPNLPRQAYSDNDWTMLQSRQCSFDYSPDGNDCQQTRKTSCALVTELVPR